MPPHCDTIDGPVVQAAKKAIDQVNVLYVLPWVPKESEQEVRDAFEDVMHARAKHPDAQKVADRWFFETVVRLHRMMEEGMPYTGLKPAGLEPGPAVRLAEKALESGDIDDLKDFFEAEIEIALEKRLARIRATVGADLHDTEAVAQNIQATLSFLRLANDLHNLLTRVERADRIREAEEAAKEKIGQSYSKRHHATAEALAHHS